jgi:outer membrane protein OmpA-like peptidoglycan-associated protein
MNRSFLVLGLLFACKKPGPLQQYHAEIQTGLQGTAVDEWAERCAPRELALAQTHREFAELEFQQGDTRRAEEHLLIARENVGIALRKAEVCRPKDRDKDGIFDHLDACPDEPENKNGFQDDDGCPEFDRDGDGIKDEVDACPEQPEDMDNFQDADGCPEADNDFDGVLDTQDRCPNEAEDKNGYQDEDGCPEGDVDRDRDGIRNDLDQCPDQPENRNDYLDEDGCPDSPPSNVKIVRDQIVIKDMIQFETGKARILPMSYGILNSVAQVMKDYDKIRVRVEGHTDNQGSDSYNLKLSNDRAASVKAYLISQGIKPERLESVGMGESRPIDTNNTPSGRQANRRVEFHITDGQ